MRTLLAVAAIAALGGGMLAWATHGGRALTAETARRLAVQQDPVALPELGLQLQTGRRTGLTELEGQLVVATLMYTRCRTTCPLLGQRMARIRDRLPDRALGRDVRFLSLSFDPATDTPRRLKAYARRYGAEAQIWWVARPVGALDRLLDRLGVVVLPNDGGGYTHNAAFYLIDRQGRVVRIVDQARTERLLDAVERRL